MEENNQEVKNNEFKNISSDNSKAYQSFSSSQSTKKNVKSNISFGKNVALPFLCGILGAGIVIGSCVRSSHNKK